MELGGIVFALEQGRFCSLSFTFSLSFSPPLFVLIKDMQLARSLFFLFEEHTIATFFLPLSFARFAIKGPLRL